MALKKIPAAKRIFNATNVTRILQTTLFFFISNIIKLDFHGRKFFITEIIETIINYSLS